MNGLDDYSGEWSFFDCDSAGKGIYTNSAQQDTYLCFNYDYNLWFLSATRECSTTASIYAYCKWTNADITQCGAGAWRKLQSNTFVEYPAALIFDCNNGAFNAGETTTCTDTSLNDKICVRGNSDFISSDNPLEFELFNTECAYNKPIYSYVYISSNTSIITINGIQEQSVTEKTYYLHYNLYKKYSDDEEFSGQWVISDGEVNSNYDAVCEQEILTNCLEGEWQILDITDETGGGLIEFIDDVVMTIDNADCDGNTNFATESGDESGDNAMIIIIVCIVVLLLVGIGAFFLWKRSNKGDDDMIKRHVSNNNHANKQKETPETDQMPDTGSPQPETEVSMERKATDGATEIVVTTTVE